MIDDIYLSITCHCRHGYLRMQSKRDYEKISEIITKNGKRRDGHENAAVCFDGVTRNAGSSYFFA